MPRLRLAGLLLATLLPAVPLRAQFPPAELKNVQSLPEGMTVRAVIDTMKAFTRALGVRCTYCHVGEEGKPLAEYDFASDDKPTKLKARAMIEMVRAINRDHLAKLPDRVEPPLAVACATCHRGVAIPRPIDQLVLTSYRTTGLDSAIARYRALRERYYGGAAYDFGEVPLSDVADAVAADGKPADALAFLRLNAELLPTSGFAYRQLGFGLLAVGDTAAAKAAWQKRLELTPENREAQQLLKRLEGR